jgi:hypothetical protein
MEKSRQHLLSKKVFRRAKFQHLSEREILVIQSIDGYTAIFPVFPGWTKSPAFRRTGDWDLFLSCVETLRDNILEPCRALSYLLFAQVHKRRLHLNQVKNAGFYIHGIVYVGVMGMYGKNDDGRGTVRPWF